MWLVMNCFISCSLSILFAERLESIATTMLHASKSVRELKEAAMIFVEAAKMRGVFDLEPDSLPEELFVKPIHNLHG
jgi:hypothetical protein